MKRLPFILLAAAGLLSGACGGGGEEKDSPSAIAAEKCQVPVEQITLINQYEGSGYNGKGPGYLKYKTEDGRLVNVYSLGDGDWTTYSGGCE